MCYSLLYHNCTLMGEGMKTKFGINDSVIVSEIEENYCLNIQEIVFLPEGDISYAYIITCKDRTKYFLKLFDKSSEKGKESVKLLDFYLPLTWEMYYKGLYKNITYPIKSIKDSFQVNIGTAVIVLFSFIEGKTLAEAYPFSRFLLEKVARGISDIHRVTYQLSIDTPKVENFMIPFEKNLMLVLEVLENTDMFENEDIQNLKTYIISRKNKVLYFLKQLHIYQEEIKNNQQAMVLTHGDIWGGNLILGKNDILYFIDWESAMIAPREADLRHYLFEEFDYFIEKYIEQSREHIKLDSNIFGFYTYRSHLANLTNWISRMLYNNQSSEQNKSDFECITFHCMERWDSVEDKMKVLNNILS